MIVLRYVNSPTSRGVTFKYQTLLGAMKRAHRLVTATPKRDHDGYAVHPKTGNCLFLVEGVTFNELFPAIQP
jgi:hypothetical protein